MLEYKFLFNYLQLASVDNCPRRRHEDSTLLIGLTLAVTDLSPNITMSESVR